MPIMYIVREWRPFQIDALGIVTLIGAKEVSVAVGRLATNGFTQCLPTVGAYVFARNDFMTPISGFQAFSLDDYMFTTDVPGWFGRWLLSQRLKVNATSLDVTYQPSSRGRDSVTIAAAILGFTAHVPTIVLSALIGDWWGLICAVLMTATTWSRCILIERTKSALDQNAQTGIHWHDGTDIKTSFWILPTGEAVTIRCPKGLLVNCLLTTPRIDQSISFFARVLGWIAFGGFVISLGMACLCIQILIVTALLTGTIAIVLQLGDDDQMVGSRLEIRLTSDPSHSDHRLETYFRLGLNKEQEDTMLRWSLFPQRYNVEWWRRYEMHSKAGI